jgi:hypothetical protein
MSSEAVSTRAVPRMMTLQPSATVWSSASNRTLSFMTVLNNLVPSAVRNSTVRSG